MSHHMIENRAMHGLQFCDPKRGIHGAMPFETVHTIPLDWHVYLNSAFFKQKKQSAEIQLQSRKRNEVI